MTKDHLNLSTDNAQDSLFSIDDCNEAYQYLQNSANFVSFHTGLTTLMQRCRIYRLQRRCRRKNGISPAETCRYPCKDHGNHSP